MLRLIAVGRRLPPGAAFSGRTAAWLHGLDVTPDDPIDVTVPPRFGHRVGAVVHRAELAPGEIVSRRGLPTTSALRTVVDLVSRESLTEGVVAADLFAHTGSVKLEALRRYTAAHPGAKGTARLNRVIDLADPRAESPMESRLRILLVGAGLPTPDVNSSIEDEKGQFVARPDLLYRAQRLAIEFDGGNHRDRLVDDNRRQNRLIQAGYRLLRFTAVDVYGAPEIVVLRVRDCLAAGRP